MNSYGARSASNGALGGCGRPSVGFVARSGDRATTAEGARPTRQREPATMAGFLARSRAFSWKGWSKRNASNQTLLFCSIAQIKSNQHIFGASEEAAVGKGRYGPREDFFREYFATADFLVSRGIGFGENEL